MFLFSPVIPAVVHEVPATKISQRQIKVRTIGEKQRALPHAYHWITGGVQAQIYLWLGLKCLINNKILTVSLDLEKSFLFTASD